MVDGSLDFGDQAGLGVAVEARWLELVVLRAAAAFRCSTYFDPEKSSSRSEQRIGWTPATLDEQDDASAESSASGEDDEGVDHAANALKTSATTATSTTPATETPTRI